MRRERLPEILRWARGYRPFPMKATTAVKLRDEAASYARFLASTSRNFDAGTAMQVVVVESTIGVAVSGSVLQWQWKWQCSESVIDRITCHVAPRAYW